MDGPSALIPLFHRRWTIPVIAQLHRAKGDRFASMVSRLEVGRSTLKETLEELIEMGLVAPNPGYGHPLRPEYILTERGKELGAPADGLLGAIEASCGPEIALRKWTIPIISALLDGARRFSALRRALSGVTDRALAQALKQMESAGLISREIEDRYPPAPVYMIAPGLDALVAAVRRLLRAVVRSNEP